MVPVVAIPGEVGTPSAVVVKRESGAIVEYRVL